MRLHLFEFEDQPWFPAPLRVAMTSYLVAAYGITPFPKLWAARLSGLMHRDTPNKIVDLASGSGGPLRIVLREFGPLGYPLEVTLTDLYPNGREYHFPANTTSAIRYWPYPVDATEVPAELTGIRTMFAAFHHFRPADARRILSNAAAQRQHLCIFEATSRTPLAIVLALLIPVLVLVLTPKVRPLTWFQVVFTYLIPVLPLLIFWDGLVSQLRTYSVEELEELVRPPQSPDYRWDCGWIEVPGNPMRLPYLIGHPS